jgi:hypothetical protein
MSQPLDSRAGDPVNVHLVIARSRADVQLAHGGQWSKKPFIPFHGKLFSQVEQALRQVRTVRHSAHAGSDTHAKSVVHPLDPVYIGNLSDRRVGSCVPGGFTYEKDFGSLALCWHRNKVSVVLYTEG